MHASLVNCSNSVVTKYINDVTVSSAYTSSDTMCMYAAADCMYMLPCYCGALPSL